MGLLQSHGRSRGAGRPLGALGARLSGSRIIVHSLAHARAALAAAAALDIPVILASAAGAGAYAGPLWFKALIDEAQRDHPAARVTAMLDCDDQAGTVLGALRAGLKHVIFTGPDHVRAKLAAIAAAQGAAIEEDAQEGLDLLDARDPEALCRAYLARNKTAD